MIYIDHNIADRVKKKHVEECFDYLDKVVYFLYRTIFVDGKYSNDPIVKGHKSLHYKTEESLFKCVSTMDFSASLDVVSHTRRNIKPVFNDSRIRNYLVGLRNSSGNLNINKILGISSKEEFLNIYDSHQNLLQELLEDDEVKSMILKIFDYRKFSNKGGGFIGSSKEEKWNAAKFCFMLNQKVCPYCNRHYTNSVKKIDGEGVLIRPALDHFFCKEKYPYFALTAFNLIPSCTYCNSNIKGNDISFDFDRRNFSLYPHPYLDDLNDTYRFNFKFDDKDPKDIDVTIAIESNNKLIVKHTDFFGTKDIYGSLYKQEAIRMKELRNDYPDIEIKKLAEFMEKDFDYVQQLIFGSDELEKVKDKSAGKFYSDLRKKVLEL